ncbi:MAG: hypothetical protein PHX83_01895 [Acidobacteriia bacterium]|nr:hypothetical protein [Terriglobia bacterium]
MSFTFEELKHKDVTELREIAKGLGEEVVQGYTQLNKEHLLEALCKALHIDMHVHHEVVGVDKSKIKAQMKELKKKREAALAAHDHKSLHTLRRELHGLRRKVRRALI